MQITDTVHPVFSFLYDGVPVNSSALVPAREEKSGVLTEIFSFPDGLRIERKVICHGGALEWVQYFENRSDHQSGVISALKDCAIRVPLPHTDPLPVSAYQPAFGDLTAVYAPSGSDWSAFEFTDFPDTKRDNRYTGHLPVGEERCYAPAGGRSSNAQAPFFQVHEPLPDGGTGYIFAVGWSGEWTLKLTREADALRISCGIRDCGFYLLPGERFRTASFVILPYNGSVYDGRNQWRRLLRRDFSLIGRKGRPAYGPLCAGIWGGMPDAGVLDRIRKIRENALPFEYIWMDAGWYGEDTQPTPNEFEGDWYMHTGDWTVSPLIHPGGLKDVSEILHEAGMKFILWFEPERVKNSVPAVKAHPEWFLPPEDPENTDLLLNLGDPEAWQYCFNLLSEKIRGIGIDCLRQDFNTDPLPFWQKHDAEGRKGITEILYINGLYHLWDRLLETFPGLIIDNCASGGRRIDIETARRSIALWRSDFMCPANFAPEGAQNHHLAFNSWLPYTGTGSGRSYDVYRIRSVYSPALTTNYTFDMKQPFGEAPAELEFLQRYLNEYRRVRPYFDGDFYPLTEVSERNDVWAASQLHLTEVDTGSAGEKGVLLFFRRLASPYETAVFFLFALREDREYIFEDADEKDPAFRISGKELIQRGLKVTLPEKRSSKLLFYRTAEAGTI